MFHASPARQGRKYRMDPSVWLKGQLLVAMPGLDDPHFHQSVTCIGEHSDQGAMGIVVNRTHEALTAGAIFQELHLACSPEAAGRPLFMGGPVHANEVFILHGPPLRWQGSFTVTASLAMSNSIDLLRAIAEGQGPRSYLISLGCAGWGPGQLEAEMRQNAWLTAPMDEGILFETAVSRRWAAALQRLGIDPARLSAAAGSA
jgi:putative transcriptional regulator